ncbi:MAG: lipopolysaccharide biosynthesis protein [Pseudomonadota bacterium]
MKVLSDANLGFLGRSFGGEALGVTILKYAKSLSGDGSRILIQLIYFYLVANTLSIEEFGLFATASAVGIVLSRLNAFGFISPLYRASAVKPHLIGTFTAGYIAALILSLPVIVGLAFGAHAAFFAGKMLLLTFALIVTSEVLFWRGFEVCIAVVKGTEKFGVASIMIVFAFAMKAVAAAILAFGSDGDLDSWATIYVSVQGVMFVTCAALFYPKKKLRFYPRLYLRRWREALTVAGSDMLMFAQMELDKLIVLSLAGEFIAGIYSMVMRLVDLTATPVRVFSTILTQRLMRTPELLQTIKVRALIETGVIGVSLAGIGAIVSVLWLKPDILGSNVAAAVPFLFLVALIPAFKNLIEYHAELLYGRGQTGLRLINYALLGAGKMILMTTLLLNFPNPEQWFIWTNAVFAALYACSFLLTYTSLKRPAVRI